MLISSRLRSLLVVWCASALLLSTACDKPASPSSESSNSSSSGAAPTTKPTDTPPTKPTDTPPTNAANNPATQPATQPPTSQPPTSPPPAPPPSAVTKSFAALPKNMAEFKTMFDAEAKTPEGGALMFVVALLAQAEGVADAEAMILAVQHPSTLINGAIGPSMASRYKDVRPQPQIARSYIVGTKPQDNYALPPTFSVDMRPDGSGFVDPGGSVKLFVFSSGAASPRPIQLKLDADGNWKVREVSSLLSGVQKP